MSLLIIPDVDVYSSTLVKAYRFGCVEYDVNRPLVGQFKQVEAATTAKTAVVHGFGYFVFVVGWSKGLFRQVERLIVLDGSIPMTRKFAGERIQTLFADVPSQLYFFPTAGFRAPYKLESEVIAPIYLSHRDNSIQIVRGQGFEHEILSATFDVERVRTLIDGLITLSPSKVFSTVVHPRTTVEESGVRPV
jgi:hypothetical protein